MNLAGKRSIAVLIALCACVAGFVFLSDPEKASSSGSAVHHLAGAASTGLGLGHLPILGGSAGALAGVFLSLGINRLRLRSHIAITAALVALAIPICGHGSSDFLEKDDPRIVADELLVFPLATLGLPIRQHPVMLGGVFLTSRILDGTKPPPARAAERLPGGAGIVLDDAVANAWTLLMFGIGFRLRRHRPDSRRSSGPTD